MSNSFNMLLPQNVRGTWQYVRLQTSNSEFQEVINITGHGKLYTLLAKCLNLNDTIEVRLTIDGTLWGNVISHTGDTVNQSIVPDYSHESTPQLIKLPGPITEPRLFNFEYSTSLLIETRRSAGSNSDIICTVHYSLDNF